MDLIAHWPLVKDASDASGNGHHGNGRNVELADGTAVFDGKGSLIDVPADPGLNLSAGDFTIGAWVCTQAGVADCVGDIISRFDPEHRTGFSLCVKDSSGAPSNTPNVRNLQFWMDCGTEPVWEHCGRPGNTRMIYALQVHDGGLYAATHETGADDRGHVFRHAGGDEWIDCGAPDERNGVCSLASFEGDLYAAAMCDDMAGSLQPPARNLTPGAGVYRYLGGTDWEPCGSPFPESFTGLCVHGNALYARNTYHPDWYRYEGEGKWERLETPNIGFWGCAEFHGKLYASAKRLKPRIHPGIVHPDPYVNVWRLEPDAGWKRSSEGLKGQVYAFTTHRGELFAGTWPEGKIFRTSDGERWNDCGACGLAPIEGVVRGEIMGMAPYNGKLYIGTLPLAEVYRYDGDGRWALVKRLDATPDAPIRRAWSVAEYDGRLFFGTLPGGAVHAMRTGAAAFTGHELAPGWRHVAAVRGGDRLRLYIDGALAAESDPFAPSEHNLDTGAPMRIGFGPHDYFNGRMRGVRLYRRALAADEIVGLSTT